jgi:transposase-like protein
MPRYRTAYPPEFRRQMVDLVRSGRTPEELAREFEPTAQSISTWVKQAERDAGKRVDGPSRKSSARGKKPLPQIVRPGLKPPHRPQRKSDLCHCSLTRHPSRPFTLGRYRRIVVPSRGARICFTLRDTYSTVIGTLSLSGLFCLTGISTLQVHYPVSRHSGPRRCTRSAAAGVP